MEGTTQKGGNHKIATEFGSWPIEGGALENVNSVRANFDSLLRTIAPMFPNDSRYLAIVKTKLEEACLFTIKGISVPATGGN